MMLNASTGASQLISCPDRAPFCCRGVRGLSGRQVDFEAGRGGARSGDGGSLEERLSVRGEIIGEVRSRRSCQLNPFLLQETGALPRLLHVYPVE
jgi:hypothetical protein